MKTPIDETVLQITRVFDAPPTRVFRAWLDREEWQAWMGPEDVWCDVPLLEPRVGGRYRVIMHLPNGETLPIGGVFQLIDEPRRLAFSWGRDGDPERQSLVTLTFRDLGGKTELTLRHEGLATVANRDAHAKGWRSALSKLGGYLARPTLSGERS